MGIIEQFVHALKESVKFQNHLFEYKPGKIYYENQYAKPIIKYYTEHNVKSYEVAENKKNGLTSICSLASSGRLCFLDFFQSEVEFEKPIYNDVPSSTIPTKMDAVIGNCFYECKCQEIVNGEHESLRSSYLFSKLFKDFGINDISTVIKKEKKNGQYVDVEYLSFPMRNLGVDIDANYDELHFNVKQLICHLIAIGNIKDSSQKQLQYVIYTPASKHYTVDIENLYGAVKKEINEIWKSKKIQDYCEAHNIYLCPVIFKSIDQITDSVYPEAFKKY